MWVTWGEALRHLEYQSILEDLTLPRLDNIYGSQFKRRTQSHIQGPHFNSPKLELYIQVLCKLYNHRLFSDTKKCLR